MYYLETNSLISLKNKLQQPVISSRCYTSSLSIVEILKYLNKRSFYVKRNLLLALKESTISIDWDLPSYKSFSAFPAVRNHGDKSDELKTIHALILNSESYEEFLKKQKQAKIQTTIETITKYCGFFDSVSTETLSGLRQMTQDITKKQGKTLFNFGDELSRKSGNLPIDQVLKSLDLRRDCLIKEQEVHGFLLVLFPELLSAASNARPPVIVT